MLDALIQLQVVGQAHDLPIDAGAHEPALEHVLKEVLVLAFLSAHNRGQKQKTGSLGQRQDAGDDLFPRLGGNRPAAFRAVALANAGVQDAEVVVDLGDRADRRTWVAAGRLLLDADRRRQAAQVIDVRLLELAEELAGIAGERLHVAPLAFRVEGVERQGAFPRPAHAREHDEPVAGQIQADVAEVMFPCAADDDVRVIHNRRQLLLACWERGKHYYTSVG
jgi:hypothetical protein